MTTEKGTTTHNLSWELAAEYVLEHIHETPLDEPECDVPNCQVCDCLPIMVTDRHGSTWKIEALDWQPRTTFLGMLGKGLVVTYRCE